MRTVNKRELNHRTAQVLDHVATTGEPVTVTERGVPKWRVEPFGEARDPYARAIQEGRITPASNRSSAWPPPPRAGRRTSADVSRLIAEMKGDR
ncbi:MAG: type II toxin-antitoxin system prevent-host-death family antitoxin [Propionibacteriaceae bacterium]|jgi:prevent-host-death family protein|nr:type II toxin-antitoxin system prevent-host-death family antitoxin [Propionibacteriaceae bacterium]